MREMNAVLRKGELSEYGKENISGDNSCADPKRVMVRPAPDCYYFQLHCLAGLRMHEEKRRGQG